MLVGHSVGNHQGNELTCNSSGNARPRRLSPLSHRGLILAYKVEIVCELISIQKTTKKAKRRL